MAAHFTDIYGKGKLFPLFCHALSIFKAQTKHRVSRCWFSKFKHYMIFIEFTVIFHFFHVCLFRNNFSKVADKKLRWNVSDLWCFKRYLWTLIVNNRPSRDKQQTNWIVLCKYRLFTLQSVSLRKTLQRVGGFIKANSEVGGKFKTVCFESNKLKAN